MRAISYTIMDGRISHRKISTESFMYKTEYIPKNAENL